MNDHSLTSGFTSGGARVDVQNNEGKSAIDILPNLLEIDRSLLPLALEQIKAQNAGTEYFINGTLANLRRFRKATP